MGTSALLASGLAVLASGCSQEQDQRFESYSDQSRTQIMFYSPPGATVTVKGGYNRGHQIAAEGAYGHRLEYTPEEFSVFNLKPGKYEFKYTTAEGLPGVSVYGELDVRNPCSDEGKMFRRRSFVPLALPSAYYRRVETIGNEIYPYRGESLRRAIDDLDLVRLKQGDVIEKVVFVADLEEVEAMRDETEQELAELEREIEYADNRFRNEYIDDKFEIDDPWANFWHTDRSHIKWERKRVSLQQELDRKEALMDRVNALLRFDRVLVRKGMLVVATEEVVESHRDPVEAASELGEVMLVMRVGGRHMHWGDSATERAAYESDGQ
jgi:hypothetical protein